MEIIAHFKAGSIFTSEERKMKEVVAELTGGALHLKAMPENAVMMRFNFNGGGGGTMLFTRESFEAIRGAVNILNMMLEKETEVEIAETHLMKDANQANNKEEIRRPFFVIAQDVQRLIAIETERAMKKFPLWPEDLLHALAIVGEEYGELNKAILQHIYEPEKGVTLEDIKTEAVQTGAMIIRLLVQLETGTYEKEYRAPMTNWEIKENISN